MRTRIQLIVSFVLLAWCVCAVASPLNRLWQSDPQHSVLSFVSVKKDAIAEIHYFDRFNVRVDDAHQLVANIDLESVRTGVEIRDERMREFLFDVVQFPQATITADLSQLEFKLDVGVPTTVDLPAWLSLHGVERKLDMKVSLVKLNDDQVLISSAVPVIVNAPDFELSAGVLKLADLVGGIDIATAVPVTFQVLLVAN